MTYGHQNPRAANYTTPDQPRRYPRSPIDAGVAKVWRCGRSSTPLAALAPEGPVEGREAIRSDLASGDSVASDMGSLIKKRRKRMRKKKHKKLLKKTRWQRRTQGK